MICDCWFSFSPQSFGFCWIALKKKQKIFLIGWPGRPGISKNPFLNGNKPDRLKARWLPTRASWFFARLSSFSWKLSASACRLPECWSLPPSQLENKTKKLKAGGSGLSLPFRSKACLGNPDSRVSRFSFFVCADCTDLRFDFRGKSCPFSSTRPISGCRKMVKRSLSLDIAFLFFRQLRTRWFFHVISSVDFWKEVRTKFPLKPISFIMTIFPAGKYLPNGHNDEMTRVISPHCRSNSPDQSFSNEMSEVCQTLRCSPQVPFSR